MAKCLVRLARAVGQEGGPTARMALLPLVGFAEGFRDPAVATRIVARESVPARRTEREATGVGLHLVTRPSTRHPRRRRGSAIAALRRHAGSARRAGGRSGVRPGGGSAARLRF